MRTRVASAGTVLQAQCYLIKPSAMPEIFFNQTSAMLSQCPTSSEWSGYFDVGRKCLGRGALQPQHATESVVFPVHGSNVVRIGEICTNH
jgi:hypothetical protein